jgi:general secretion pathway protein K
VVAIAAVLAVELAWETALDLRRTEGLIARDQAMQFAFGAEALAGKILREDAERDSTNAIDWLGEDWAQPTAFNLDQGSMTGGIADLQGRFNLNNLVRRDGTRDEIVLRQFERLLAALDLDPAIADAVADWIDPDTNAGFAGAEDGVYTNLDPPYRAANFWLTSISELRAVRGIEALAYARLAPHVAALPIGGKATVINVNTATPAVLQSLGDDVSPANVEQWVTDREREPFENLEVFDLYIDPALRPYLAVGSDYFSLQGSVSIGSTRLGMYSLLERTPQKTVMVRSRSFDAIEAAPDSSERTPADVDQEVAGSK